MTADGRLASDALGVVVVPLPGDVGGGEERKDIELVRASGHWHNTTVPEETSADMSHSSSNLRSGSLGTAVAAGDGTGARLRSGSLGATAVATSDAAGSRGLRTGAPPPTELAGVRLRSPVPSGTVSDTAFAGARLQSPVPSGTVSDSVFAADPDVLTSTGRLRSATLDRSPARSGTLPVEVVTADPDVLTSTGRLLSLIHI